jgi:hypothetical protein
MKFDNAINIHRKSGGAQWRDLLLTSHIAKPNGHTTLPFVIPTEA